MVVAEDGCIVCVPRLVKAKESKSNLFGMHIRYCTGFIHLICTGLMLPPLRCYVCTRERASAGAFYTRASLKASSWASSCAKCTCTGAFPGVKSSSHHVLHVPDAESAIHDRIGTRRRLCKVIDP